MMHFSKIGSITLLFIIFLLVIFPLFSGAFLLNAAILSSMYFSLAVIWGFMAKHAGMVSLGQQMMVGVGGYTTTVLCMYYGLPIWVSVLISGLMGGCLAGILSFPLLKLRGFYFAIGTMVTSEIIKLIFTGWEFVGGGMGLIFRQAYGFPLYATYYSSLALAFVSAFLVYFLYYSKLGFGLRALAGDEYAASAIGVNPFICRSVLFIMVSIISSFVGALYALLHPYIEPVTFFSIFWTTSSVFVSIIGGVGTVIGPIFGSVIFMVLMYLLSAYVGLNLLLQGIITAAFILVIPSGIWGLIIKKIRGKNYTTII